jgi:hypothetical protein
LVLIIALALLILAVRLRVNRIPESVLGNIAEWVIALEALEEHNFACCGRHYLPISFNLDQGAWQPVAEEFKGAIATITAEGVRINLHLCVLLLETGWNNTSDFTQQTVN